MADLLWDTAKEDWLAASATEGRLSTGWSITVAAAVLALLGTFVWAVVGLVAGVAASACQYSESREGAGFEKLEGATIDDARQRTVLRIAVRNEVDLTVPPGTVLRVSRCNVPGGADLVAYVAVSS